MRARSSSPYFSGHNAAPSARFSGSLRLIHTPSRSPLACSSASASLSARAGRQITSYWSAPGSSTIILSSRPAQSSGCQRVIIPTTAPPSSRRVYAVLRHHAHTRSRAAALSASSRFLKRSSRMSKWAPLPVIAPPTPAATTPPRLPATSHDCADRLSSLTCTGVSTAESAPNTA